MERREFVKFALASAAVTSGCIGDGGEGGNDDGADGSTTQEPAEFGYETWVPTGEYTNVAYADMTRLREKKTLEIDTETATVTGDVGPKFADVDGYISTGNNEPFDAYHGEFDSETLLSDVSGALSETEETEHEGYSVVRGTEGENTTKEVVVSDSFVVYSPRQGGATRVVDAALGKTDRQVEESDLMQGLNEYAEDPPLVVFNRAGNAAYRFLQENNGTLEFVEVAPQENVETAEKVLRDYDCQSKYNDSLCTTIAERQGRNVIITSGAGNLSQYLEEYF